MSMIELQGISLAFPHKTCFSNFHAAMDWGQRIAIVGDNGSGKSTLARAILAAPRILRHGDWLTPDARAIGYLDQHYANLDPAHSVLQALKHVAPGWSTAQLRQHLSDFLFRHNIAVEAKVSTLSGGEKARLSLACIAARVPELLILDEVTNNLDLATRRHVIDVLRDFPRRHAVDLPRPGLPARIGRQLGIAALARPTTTP